MSISMATQKTVCGGQVIMKQPANKHKSKIDFPVKGSAFSRIATLRASFLNFMVYMSSSTLDLLLIVLNF